MPDRKLLILQGPPGAGKGTQAELYSHSRPGVVPISLGDVIRSIHSSALDSAHANFIQNGYYPHQIMPNEIANDIVFDAISNHGHQEMSILDGYPQESGALDLLIERAYRKNIRILGCIALMTTEETSVVRMTERGTRSQENLMSMDLQQYFRERYRQYMHRYPSIKNAFISRGLDIVTIDSSRNIHSVQAELIATINTLDGRNI